MFTGSTELGRLLHKERMILPTLLLLASSLLLVESAISQGPCTELGTETTRETWKCKDEASTCSLEVDSCSSDGEGVQTGGTAYYEADGTATSTGGWDCRH